MRGSALFSEAERSPSFADSGGTPARLMFPPFLSQMKPRVLPPWHKAAALRRINLLSCSPLPRRELPLFVPKDSLPRNAPSFSDTPPHPFGTAEISVVCLSPPPARDSLKRRLLEDPLLSSLRPSTTRAIFADEPADLGLGFLRPSLPPNFAAIQSSFV